MRYIALLLFLFSPVLAQDNGQPLLLFEKLDSNSDGELSHTEVEASGRKSAWLGIADRDGNKTVSRDELQAFIESRRPSKDAPGEVTELVSELPEDSPVSLAGMRKAAEVSASKNGFTFLVAVEGKVVYERYEPGWAPEKPHRLASGTKSFSAALLAAAVKDGILSSLDEKVSDTLTEWGLDSQLGEITYRQLLSLSSGLDPGDNGKVPSYGEAKTFTAVSAAGEKFRYGPNAFQAFGEALRRKLVASPELDFADPLAYLEARVFESIGLSYAQWRRDKTGMPHLPSGAFLTAGEWWKYGEFLRNGGSWNGRQLVDQETLLECFQPSPVNGGYGITVWLLDAAKSGSSWGKGGFMAAGAGKQRLYVLPEKGVVVVRQGDSRRYEDKEILKALFPGGKAPWPALE